MSLRIFHTGDNHIGMGFKNYPDDVRNRLIKARLETLEKMIYIANEMKTDLFVIAGDLFNSINISKKEIFNVVSIINKFNGLVLIIPGNHDYDNGGIELWKSFMNDAKEGVIYLDAERPYLLKQYDIDAIIYPAPCHSKHSKDNNLRWIKEIGEFEEAKYHIGIAHGAIEGLSPDIEGNYFYMTMDELNSIPVDLWLLGHTHVSYPTNNRISNNKIFNAGTHEPDGLDCKHEGYAWFIELKEDGCTGERITTGQYKFFDQNFEVEKEDDFDKIKNWIQEKDPPKTILRLNLKGSLNKEEYESISNHYRELESMLFYLKIEDSELKRKIDKEFIDNEFVEGSFPNEFLNHLVDDEDALQLAYNLIRRQ